MPLFGYVKPFKPDLRVCEFDTYKAFYCGLCHQLGSSFGPFSKLTLSYDFAFLSLLQMALDPADPLFSKCRCMANPLKIKVCCTENIAQRFSAGCAMIMAYYKIKDDLRDHGMGRKLRAVLCYPFIARARKKASRTFPQVDAVMAAATRAQQQLEDQHCASIDRAADPTATFLQQVFAQMAQSDAQRRILGRMGYLLGRWIYLIDAFDDLESDLQRGDYNPLALQFGLQKGQPVDWQTIGASITEICNLTVGQLAASYQLLDLYHYQSILDNIIYLGFKHTQGLILDKYKGEN